MTGRWSAASIVRPAPNVQDCMRDPSALAAQCLHHLNSV